MIKRTNFDLGIGTVGGGNVRSTGTPVGRGHRKSQAGARGAPGRDRRDNPPLPGPLDLDMNIFIGAQIARILRSSNDETEVPETPGVDIAAAEAAAEAATRLCR